MNQFVEREASPHGGRRPSTGDFHGREDNSKLLALLISLAVSGCAGDDAPDPLDPELIRTISMARSDTQGDAHGGAWQLMFEVDTCDCPIVTVDAQSLDLCALASFAGQGFVVELIHSDGLLAIPSGPEASFGVLSGAIESDESFSVAAVHDASTLAGPLESLARIDGRFTGDSVEGWAGQRLIGEVNGVEFDCRWLGDFVGARL